MCRTLYPRFSAALCRGLIEAMPASQSLTVPERCFPRLYAAASLKRHDDLARGPDAERVFRGFMPRPH